MGSPVFKPKLPPFCQDTVLVLLVVVQLDWAGVAVWDIFCFPYISILSEPWNLAPWHYVELCNYSLLSNPSSMVFSWLNLSLCLREKLFGHLICFCIWGLPDFILLCLPFPHLTFSWFLFVPANILYVRATPQLTCPSPNACSRYGSCSPCFLCKKGLFFSGI